MNLAKLLKDDIQIRFEKVESILKAHIQAIDWLLDIAVQGGCDNVHTRNLPFCCLTTDDYTTIGKRNELLDKTASNIAKRVTLGKGGTIFGWIDSVWEWLTKWLNWDWIVIIGGILSCVVILVTCGLPLLCCVIRQIKERLQELHEQRPDHNMYELMRVAL